jgi:hypothetical protein
LLGRFFFFAHLVATSFVSILENDVVNAIYIVVDDNDYKLMMFSRAQTRAFANLLLTLVVLLVRALVVFP